MKSKQSFPIILITRIAVFLSFILIALYWISNIYQIIMRLHQGFAFYIGTITWIIPGIFNVIELWFLVLIFWRLRPNELFISKNILYIKFIGIISIIKGLFGGIRTLLPMIENGDTRLLYLHAFGSQHLGWNSIIMGLLTLVIAVSFERAYRLQEEQSLTV